MKTAVLLLLSGVLLVFYGCSPQAVPENTTIPASSTAISNPGQYLDQGIAAYNAGSYREAIDSLTVYIGSNPKSAGAFYYRGCAYNHEQDTKKALADLSKAVELNKRYLEAFYERGSIYFYNGEWKNAIDDYTKTIQIDEQFLKAYYSRGLAYIRNKEYDKAIRDMEIAGSLDINDGELSDLRELTDKAIPPGELVLMKLDLLSKQTGICSGGCSAPISYNVTVRVIMFANPVNTDIQIIGAEISPAISWLSEIQLKGSIYKPGVETLAANVASAEPYSDKATCTIKYVSGNNTAVKQSNEVKN